MDETRYPSFSPSGERVELPSELDRAMAEVCRGQRLKIRTACALWPQADEPLTQTCRGVFDDRTLTCSWGAQWLNVEARVKFSTSFAIGMPYQIWREPAGELAGRAVFGWQGAYVRGDERVLTDIHLDDLVAALMPDPQDFMLITRDKVLLLTRTTGGDAAGRISLFVDLANRLEGR